MKRYDKIIRDRIPEIIEFQGKTCSYTEVPDRVATRYLKNKVREELVELVDSNYSLEEMIDVYDVLDALREKLGISDTDFHIARTKKYEERGGFKNNIILKEVSD